MKRWIFASGSLALALAFAALLPALNGCDQSAKSAPVTGDATNQPQASDATEAATSPTDAADQGLADAPGAIISTPGAAPATSNNPQLNDVVKLARAGVNEDIMMAYVTNSPNAFNVSSDDVVYLNDLGVPQTVVNAMLQRDRYFNSTAAQAPAQSEAPGQPGYPTAAPGQPAYVIPPPNTQIQAPDQSAPPSVADTTGPATADITPAPDVIDDADQATNGTYSYFYDSLSPYGNWINIDGYGPCWQPTLVGVNPGWQPYCNGGHWVYTDCGWCWVSDYSWGWAPFHYGRWFHNSRWGWCWAPDTVWGPAWVSWRYNRGYCGWAPLPPTACYRPGFGFTYFGQSVGINFGFGLAPASFVFVSLDRFQERSLSNFRVDRQQAAKIFPNTAVNNQLIRGANNILINRGVPVEQVAAATRMQIRPVHIRTDLDNPGAAQFGRDGRSLSLYKPSLPSPGLTARPTLVGEGVQRDANFDLQSHIEQAQQRPSINPTVAPEQDRRPIISNPTTTAPRDNIRPEVPANNNVVSQPTWHPAPGRADNSAPNQSPNYQRGQTYQSQQPAPAQDSRRIYVPQDSAPRYNAPESQQRERPQQPNMYAPRQETSPRYYDQPRTYESPRSAAPPAQSAPGRQDGGQSAGNGNNNGNGNGGNGNGAGGAGGGSHGH